MVPRDVHLIGIGGAGMSALAQYLLSTGRSVSGSDAAPSALCETLRASGARIACGHDAAHLGQAALVVVSDAIATGNVEQEAARQAGLPILRRAECLDALARDRASVFVAGSHGKSTTTAMIVQVLAAAGQDPGFVIGADVPCLGGVRARSGTGPHFVAEACEAFRNLEFYRPDIAVVTNVDDEHLNHYASRASLDEAFAAFATRAAHAVVSGEDAGVGRIRPMLRGAVETFGLAPDCDIWAPAEPSAFVVHRRDAPLGRIALSLPGDHMRRNALAAITACLAAGIPFERIAEGLARFTGVARRWQALGVARGVTVIDDYAHHPTAIAATLRAARAASPGARIVAALQPQLHSRVARLEAAFAESLAPADRVLLLDVDGSGETGTSPGSAAIAERLAARGTPTERLAGVSDLIAGARALLSPGDVVIAMGGRGMDGAATRLMQELARVDDAPTPSSMPAGEARDPDVAAPASGTFLDLFRRGAERHPGLPAVIDGARVLTFAELDASSDAVAAALAGRALAGRPVGVALRPSSDLIVALLGVMKAGAVYLPIDPSLPPARIRFMLERAGAGAVIEPEPGGHSVPSLTLAQLIGTIGPVPPGPSETAPAYLCFTSGSTGQPKGIRIRHASLSAFLADIVPRLALEPGSRTLVNTGIGFDVSLVELCGTLAGGGTLVVGNGRTALGEHLAGLLDANAISHLFVTPSVLASVAVRPLPALRCIVAAGEACPPRLASVWSAGRHFFNAYGPTEATIYATTDRYEPHRTLSIGTALAHVRTQVLDGDLRPVPPGEQGELCLSGPGLTEGYLGDPEETARRFVQSADGLLYRTGDLVRQGEDGRLHFLGRTDDQVKHRGVRIELGEIEHAVLRQPGIVDAAACLSTGDAPAIVCFVVAGDPETLDPAGLIERLSAWLPDSALPSQIVPVPAMPLTPSGKKDRHRLLTRHRPRTAVRASDFAPARTPTEARLAALWQRVLGLDFEVGMFDRFPALGGDSFKALTLILAIEQDFGIAVPPGYFGRIATVPHMAVLLADLLWHRDHDTSGAEGFRGSRIYRQLLDLTAQWPGTRREAGSLIATLGAIDAPCHVFLCCQDAIEFASLAAHLPSAICLHGLRSGHLVIDQGPESVRQVCAHYVEEIERLALDGTLMLAGICQGGAIAQGIAETLSARGRAVALLALIELGRFRPYAAPVALFYAQDSFANPLGANAAARPMIEAAYPQGCTIDLVPGSHGAACHEPAVRSLADHLVRRVEAVTMPSERIMASPSPDPTDPAPPVHLEAGALRIAPQMSGAKARFTLPRGTPDAWLVSRAARPCDYSESGDSRRLGLCLHAIRIEASATTSRAVALEDPLLAIGFHAVEDGVRRWTDGRARLPAALWDGDGDGTEANLVLEIAFAVPAGIPDEYDEEGWDRARTLKDIEAVGGSRLFEEDFYKSQFPDETFAERGPARHYVELGWRKGADPGPLFSTSGYLDRYPDVAAADRNPLVHYLRQGKADGRAGWSDLALMRWQADIVGNPERAVAEIERDGARVEPLEPGDLVVIHAHSRGHFVFKEFQRLLVAACQAIGLDCIVADERPIALPRKPAARFVIAPHDFYCREGGPGLATDDFVDSIPINTEQMQSVWFRHALPFLERAPYILDTNLQTAASLVRLGLKARFLPLGFLDDFDIFQPQGSALRHSPLRDGIPDLAEAHASPTNPFDARPLDLLFVGSNSARRTNFERGCRTAFRDMKAVLKLVDVTGALEGDDPRAVSAGTHVALSQLTKILLNVHHFNAPYFEWQRLMHYGFFQGACVVSETLSRVPGLEPGIHYFEDDITALPELVRWLVKDADGRRKAEDVRQAGYRAAISTYRMADALASIFGLRDGRT